MKSKFIYETNQVLENILEEASFELDKEAESLTRESSRGFPSELSSKIKSKKMLFIHSYPDMDAALAGNNVIGRPTPLFADDDIIVVKSKDMKAKEGDYIFIGSVGLKGLGKGYVEKVVGGNAYIAGMGGDLEK